jgi:hypothetical protein
MLSETGARALLDNGQEAGDDRDDSAAIRGVRPVPGKSYGTGGLRERLRPLLGVGLRQDASTEVVDSAGRAPVLYLVAALFLAVLLMGALAAANYCLAPLAYSASAVARVAESLAGGSNYAVFDLNLDSRELRRQHIARLDTTPDVVLLGASQWQEAHAELLPERRFYNAYVHRDYYEDLLAVVEMLLRHGRLPKTVIISIRDMTFQPVDRRTDTLWLTALPDYDAMAARLGITSHSWFETWPVRRWSGLLSLSTAVDNALRRLTAESLPGPTRARSLTTMDVLLADGSIQWSDDHRKLFTAERARREVALAVEARRNHAPQIDPGAVTAVDRLLALLRAHGVRVVLIHPPFNPAFYRQVENSAYGAGLRQVEAVTARLAAAHGATVVGSFDPAVAGCLESMYIDAEHSSPRCLRRVLDQVAGL